MGPLALLPKEILIEAFTYTNNSVKNLSGVCKSWKQLIDQYLTSFAQGYVRSPSLQPYLQQISQSNLTDRQKVLFVFKEIMQSNVKLGFRKEVASLQNLDPIRLEKIKKYDKFEEVEFDKFARHLKKDPKLKDLLSDDISLPLSERNQLNRAALKNHASVLETIIYLNFDNCQLEILPAEIKHFTNLETLSLNGNRLKKLPIEIRSLTKLMTLFLNYNQFKEIPSEIYSMRFLSAFSIGNNLITDFPRYIYMNDECYGGIDLEHNYGGQYKLKIPEPLHR